jgi:LEA14-like dessication related protein
MKTKSQNFLVVGLIAILFSSCDAFSEVEVGEIKDFRLNGFSNNALLVTIILPVTNPSGYPITLVDIDTRIFINDMYLGQLNSEEKLLIPSRSKNNYEMKFNIRVANFFGTALTLMNMKAGQQIRVRLEGTLKARSLLITRKIPIDENRTVVL